MTTGNAKVDARMKGFLTKVGQAVAIITWPIRRCFSFFFTGEFLLIFLERNRRKPTDFVEDDEWMESNDDSCWWDILIKSKMLTYPFDTVENVLPNKIFGSKESSRQDKSTDADEWAYLRDMKFLLTSVYLRCNLLVRVEQYCDAQDLGRHLGPITILTGVGSLLGFLAISPYAGDRGWVMNLASAFCMMITSGWTKIRASPLVGKMDVKASTARAACIEYRVLSTKLERRLRQHRESLFGMQCEKSYRSRAANHRPARLNSIDEVPPPPNAQVEQHEPGGDPPLLTTEAAVAVERRQLVRFFYEKIQELQVEEKKREENSRLQYDPDDHLTKRWFDRTLISPSNIDQPEHIFDILAESMPKNGLPLSENALENSSNDQKTKETIIEVERALFIGEPEDSKYRKRKNLKAELKNSRGL
jgi:hypothetical protein